MLTILRLVGIFIVDLFKSRRRLEAENLLLRHQLGVSLRRAPPRLRLRGIDRALMVWMIRLWPRLLGAAAYGIEDVAAQLSIAFVSLRRAD